MRGRTPVRRLAHPHTGAAFLGIPGGTVLSAVV
jgi:hypothetical protein